MEKLWTRNAWGRFSGMLVFFLLIAVLYVKTRPEILAGQISLVQNEQGRDSSVVPSRREPELSEFVKKVKAEKPETCADIYHRKLELPWNDAQAQFARIFDLYIRQHVYRGKPKHSVRIEGNSGHHPDQMRLYFDIGRLGFIKTVCETGFNAGHSAFMWLNTNPKLQVYSFDINIYNYTDLMVRALQSMFPGRLHVFYGDSRQTLASFRQTHPTVTCDLVVVDGGHHLDVPRRDLENFRSMVEPNSENLIVLDDFPGLRDVDETIGRPWREYIRKNYVRELANCMKYNNYWKSGLTLGKYT